MVQTIPRGNSRKQQEWLESIVAEDSERDKGKWQMFKE
jgi:hypothetical protein